MPQGSAMGYSGGGYRPGFRGQHVPSQVTGSKGDGARGSDVTKGGSSPSR